MPRTKNVFSLPGEELGEDGQTMPLHNMTVVVNMGHIGRDRCHDAEHLGHREAADAIVRVIEDVLANETLRTRDLGGKADTATFGKAIADAITA
jgi:hypothetical protein